MTGLTYSRRHDIAYRTGLVLQVIGAAILAVLYPMQNPFYTGGIMLFEVGVLLSGIFLLVRMSVVKKFILSTIIAGIALQIAGFYAQEQTAGSLIIGGIGLVCVGAAGMVGKEAYCFGYREGWLLMLVVFPFVVIVNLVARENHIVNAIGFSLLFLLLLSLVGKKLKQPLLSSCAPNACGKPAH